MTNSQGKDCCNKIMDEQSDIRLVKLARNGDKEAFSVLLADSGQVWFDDMRFEVVGQEVASTNLS
jgi:hypothetical protein